MFIFSVLWSLFLGAGCVVLGYLRLHGHGIPFFPILIIGAMFSVGPLLGLYALSLARRQVGVLISRRDITITQRGLFSTTQWSWPVDAVADVEVAKSGTSINNRPLMQLVISPVAGASAKLLVGRADHELAWLAFEIRAALRRAGWKPPAEDDPAPPQPPYRASSRITIITRHISRAPPIPSTMGSISRSFIVRGVTSMVSLCRDRHGVFGLGNLRRRLRPARLNRRQ